LQTVEKINALSTVLRRIVGLIYFPFRMRKGAANWLTAWWWAEYCCAPEGRKWTGILAQTKGNESHV